MPKNDPMELPGKHPDTVRKRKGNNKAASQRYVPIAEIRNDTVILKTGGLRAVMDVEALNFNLKSETEQQGIIAGYQAFINTLSFPVQVVIRSRKVNIDPYISQIRDIARKQENDLLRDQTIAYANFIEKIVDVADIMTKKFYIIIPLDDSQEKKSALSNFFKWLGLDDTEAKAIQRYRDFVQKHSKLKDRINLVESGLNNIGLITKRLTTGQLIELYYQSYNPHTSQEQKLQDNINTAPLVL
jgi:Fe2+ transport system protein B